MNSSQKRLFGYHDLIASEQTAMQQTRSVLPGTVEFLPDLIDLFLTICLYHTGNCPEIETSEGEYHSYCSHQFGLVPYSARAFVLLWEKGHYREGGYIIRNLLEVLVKIKYLASHKSETLQIWSGKNRKKSLKSIFDETAPGLYQLFYGGILSGILHGDVSATAFRVDLVEGGKTQHIMGCQWDLKRGTIFINFFLELSACYLLAFKAIFAKNLDFGILERVDTFLADLLNWRQGHASTWPNTKDWHFKMEPLLNWI